MSYSPPDPFQHNINTSSNHTRHPSLPTVYEDNDPYRIVKKNNSPRIGSMSDNGSEFDAVHSRTASDSSTTRLLVHSTGAITLPTLPTTSSIDFHDDPYASKKKWRHSGSTAATSYTTYQHDERANSYLPYSHHNRDPNQKNEPIYIEEYTAPASTSLGMGSMLQDNINDQINKGSSYLPNHTTTHSANDPNMYTDKMVNLTSELKKKKRKKKRCCGLRYRTMAALIVLCLIIIGVIIYFVWPRIPVLLLDDVDNVGSIQVVTNSTKKSYSTNWMLNMTADNTANWVPTRISTIDLYITDDKTQQIFGNGTSGAFVLAPRTKSNLVVPMSINYTSTLTNDSTFQDLYNACGVQVTSNMPFEFKQDKLNVTLHVTYHISGIAWPTEKKMPIPNLICPTS